MKDWKESKLKSDEYLPVVKSILGRFLIGEASAEEDKTHNTDLIVLKMEAVRIACRIRNHEYYSQRSYADEFTIRTGRPSGVKTELTKIIEGWGDYFFYGFADNTPGRLCAYTLGDLKVFRLWFMQQLVRNQGKAPGDEFPNFDGSSKFRAFRWDALPTEFVIAESRPPVPIEACTPY